MSDLTVTEAKALRKQLEEEANVALLAICNKWREATGLELDMAHHRTELERNDGTKSIHHYVALHAMV